MPKVGNKHFSYSAKGRKAAKKYATRMRVTKAMKRKMGMK